MLDIADIQAHARFEHFKKRDRMDAAILLIPALIMTLWLIDSSPFTLRKTS